MSNGYPKHVALKLRKLADSIDSTKKYWCNYASTGLQLIEIGHSLMRDFWLKTWSDPHKEDNGQPDDHIPDVTKKVVDDE